MERSLCTITEEDEEDVVYQESSSCNDSTENIVEVVEEVAQDHTEEPHQVDKYTMELELKLRFVKKKLTEFRNSLDEIIQIL